MEELTYTPLDFTDAIKALLEAKERKTAAERKTPQVYFSSKGGMLNLDKRGYTVGSSRRV